ncbi:PRC-barrel domain-containing protein [Methylobacterium oryzihabitans]|uniref:PRC-barrel domain containing protein n=1 Tax=Methylobacterium oryzihabitans TaxID=2499852 RepID=A0A437PEC6_9HYPH|nr:PRC-barrel domain-containing protein [Methylobacterium oryzihabitans]RVU20621.1 PRC-barrel domain containing protein [Methylobacterium oryzihabitans]
MSRPFLAAAILLVASSGIAAAQPADAQPAAPATLDNSLRPTFVAQEPSDIVASKLIGLTIQNKGNETIGSVTDVVFGPDLTVKSYVVGVGGFLGIGTKYVSVARNALTVTRVDDRTLKATIDTDKDQLRAAPEYVYLSQQDAKKDAAAPKPDPSPATGSTNPAPATK